MQYRTLGTTGIAVSTLTLGTMGFGSDTPEDEAHALLDAFLEAGGNMIDTANVYNGGVSEKIIGRWFTNRPANLTDRVVLATKGRFGTGPDLNDNGLSRRNLDRALTASLRRLQADTVDLYQLHGWDPITPIEETLSFLNDAVHAGKIRYIGLSNFTGWQLQLTLSTAQAMGVAAPVTLQPQYSLLSREIEWEIIPAALHNGIGLLPWSPLAGGFLTGKYTRGGKAAANTRAGSGNPLFEYVSEDYASKNRNWDTIDAVEMIAQNIGATPSQVALSWVTNQPSVTSPIFGARNMQQLTDNLAAADLTLDEEATATLNKISTPTPGDYPYGPFGTLQRGRYLDSSAQPLGELFPH
jgi:aryl-alcohol dehydrogenase-like predicted oxidoreductase